jgi:hypothetical protein
LLGSLPDTALDGSHERQPAIATGLTILDATGICVVASGTMDSEIQRIIAQFFRPT